MGVVRKSLWHPGGVDSEGTGKRKRGRYHAGKPYPPRSIPFGMVFGSWVVRTTTVRGLFGGTLRRIKRWLGDFQT